MSTIAIMQPYFVPYAGYFRLLARADLFVIYDCVQFPRRGYVHRNQLPDARGNAHWLTLPLDAAPRQAKIHQMAFAHDAPERLAIQRRKFPALETLPGPWRALFEGASGPLVPWLEQSLTLTCATLDLTTPMQRSSALNLPGTLKGQDRIIEICNRLGATTYINAPGGRDLYDAADFSAHGIKLDFLPAYDGPKWSILHTLMTDGAATTADTIKGTHST